MTKIKNTKKGMAKKTLSISLAKPLSVKEAYVTVPKTVTYNPGYNEVNDYNVQLIVTAKDASGKIVKGLSADD